MLPQAISHVESKTRNNCIVLLLATPVELGTNSNLFGARQEQRWGVEQWSKNPALAHSGKYFMSMQMTPNPLIKNSFASPVKEQVTGEFKGGDL